VRRQFGIDWRFDEKPKIPESKFAEPAELLTFLTPEGVITEMET